MYKQRYYPAGFLMRRFFFVLFSDKGRTTLRHFPAAWSLFVHFRLGASPTLPRKTPETSPLAGIGRARAPSFGGGGPKPAASSKQKSAVVAHRFHAPVLEVASSARHVVVRTTEDTYFAWGGGDGGAGLGVGDAKGRARPTMLPPWN